MKRAILHSWLPVLLVLAVVGGIIVYARTRPPQPVPGFPELAPYFPFGDFPVVLPQTFVLQTGVSPAPPPTAVPPDVVPIPPRITGTPGPAARFG